MADTVQFLLEQMVPELEDFERRGLFTRAEIKQIVKRRSNFEYMLKRRRALKEDYLRYVEYETNLESLRQHRKAVLLRELQASNASLRWRSSLSDRSITRRIMFIYERATRKFKGDLSLWLSYLEFCRKNGGGRMMQKVVTRALRLHPGRPGLWIYAAAWEFEGQQNATAARVLMQRGIRMCPDAPTLWLELLRMELLYAQRLQVRRKVLGLVGRDADKAKASEAEAVDTVLKKENNAEAGPSSALDELSRRVALTLFKNATAAIPSDPGFRRKFLEVLAQFNFKGKEEVEDVIYSSLAEDFTNDEECWEVRALRPLISGADEAGDKAHARAEVAQVFEEAIEACPSAKMYGRYVAYLEGVLEVAVAEGSAEASTTVEQLLQVLQKARSAGVADEAMAARSVGLLLQSGRVEEARSLLAELCGGSFRASGLLWWMRLGLEQQTRAPQELTPLVQEALKLVPLRDAGQLWITALEHFAAVKVSLEEVLSQVSSALNRAAGNGGGSEKLACAAVDWALHLKGIKGARQVYTRLLALPGPSPGLFRHCAVLEAAASSAGDASALSQLRLVCDKAVAIHGKNHPELWLEYCRQEIKAGEMERAKAVFWRAKKTLADPSTFLESYNTLTR